MNDFVRPLSVGILLLIFMTILSSCQGLAKIIYGVESPRVRTTSEILESASNIGIDSTKIYSLSYDAYIDRIFKNGSSTVHLELFDAEGYLIVPNDIAISNCSGRVADYLNLLDDSTNFYRTDSIMLKNYLGGLVSVDGNSLGTLPIQPDSFTAIINWAIYTGKLNEPIVEWTENLNDLEKTPVNIIYVNLDLREFWGAVPILN